MFKAASGKYIMMLAYQFSEILPFIQFCVLSSSMLPHQGGGSSPPGGHPSGTQWWATPAIQATHSRAA